MVVLGIDFGTSNTVAVLAGDGRPPRSLSIDGSAWMPSAVYVDDDDTLAVGRDAERKARLAPERFEPNPKRRIDDGEILLGVRVVPVVDAIAAVLRRVGEEARRQLNGRNPDQVHLTHPAQWGSSRQNVLLAGARAAGLGGMITLLPEPVAAAAHFASLPGNALPPGSALAVYDLGGGTFDCAVVGASPTGYTVLAEAGLPDVGGVDFDQTIIDHLGRTVAAADPGRWQSLTRPRTAGDRRSARALREDVRAAKETLSRYSQTDLPLPDPFEDTLLTRREFDGLIRPGIVRTVELLAATIERAGLAPNRMAGIYLVGGSSRIPLVAAVISEKLGVVATTLDQPETSVAMGAAISPGTVRPSGRTEALGPASGPGHPVPSGPVSAPQGPVRGAPGSGAGAGGGGGPRPMGTPGAVTSTGRGPAVPQPPRPSQRTAAQQVPGGQQGFGPQRPARGPSVTGPHPVPQTAGAAGALTGPHPAPQTGAAAGPVTGQHPPSGATSSGRPGPSGRNRLLVIGAVAAVVIIAVVTVVIILTSGSDTVGPGGQTTTSGGPITTSSSSKQPASAPAVPAECADAPVDANGMTPCLRVLAGPNLSMATACARVATDSADVTKLLHSLVPVTISGCTDLDGGKINVVYIQFDTTDHSVQAIDSIAHDLSIDEKSWSDGGGDGKYVTADDADVGPQLYWSYSGLPVIAFAIAASDASDPVSMADLTAFWQDSLLPQS